MNLTHVSCACCPSTLLAAFSFAAGLCPCQVLRAGADVHQPHAANFTATVPRMQLPSPFDSLNISVAAAARWEVQLSTGTGFQSILNATASSTESICRPCALSCNAAQPCSVQRRHCAAMADHWARLALLGFCSRRWPPCCAQSLLWLCGDMCWRRGVRCPCRWGAAPRVTSP